MMVHEAIIDGERNFLVAGDETDLGADRSLDELLAAAAVESVLTPWCSPKATAPREGARCDNHCCADGDIH